jgi:hypothetical protein
MKTKLVITLALDVKHPSTVKLVENKIAAALTFFMEGRSLTSSEIKIEKVRVKEITQQSLKR